jgi:thioredoxin-like negative regulator of GroEL
MKSLLIIVATLIVATVIGVATKRNQGRFKVKHNFHPLVSARDIGASLGDRATVLQFSSAFCSPCRATRMTLEHVVPEFSGIAYIEVDAESHLDLVRRLHINQTPTTIFLDAQGQEVGRAVGAPKRSQVVAVLEKF